MKKLGWLQIALVGLLALGFIAAGFSPALAQTPEAPVYTLSLSRDFGYGNGGQIRGLFSVKVSGPDGYTKVVYTIDGQVMAELTSAPFAFQFNTSSYPNGEHALAAQVTAADGTVYTTPARSANFITQAEESTGMKQILVPLLGLIFGILLLTVLGQTILFRRKGKGTPMGAARNYSVLGGSICPRCHRPTPLHLLGMNLGLGKFDYCENCGKWSVMRRVPIDMLRTAEEAEKAQADREESSTPVKEMSEEEKLREMIEKSKYEEK